MEILAENANKISDYSNLIAEDERMLHQAEVDYNEYISRPWFVIEKRTVNGAMSEILYLLEENGIDMQACHMKTFVEYFNNHQDTENEWYKIYDENLKTDFTFADPIFEDNMEREKQYREGYLARSLFYDLTDSNVEYSISNKGEKVEYFDVLTYQYLDICVKTDDKKLGFHFPVDGMGDFRKQVLYPRENESFWMLDDYYMYSLVKKIKTGLNHYLDSEMFSIDVNTFFLIGYPFMDLYRYKIYQEEQDDNRAVFREWEQDREFPDEHFYELCGSQERYFFDADTYDTSIIMGNDITVNYNFDESLEQAVNFIISQLNKTE